MGKATRWLKGLLGFKKDGGEKEKKRWGFGRKESSDLRPATAADPAWLRSYIAETEKEQSKHAIAVAAATAAAADAAVAAAQAAVAVVRLTSQGKGALFAGGKEKWAAVRIQTVFRGFLARKALRALKGLVKLQALVKGFLVRKRAAAMLHSMQALIRAQAAIRSQRARNSITNEYRARMSTVRPNFQERYDEGRAEIHSKRLPASYDPSLTAIDDSPKIVEIDTYGPRSRSRRMSTCLSEYGDDHLYHHSVSSPLPCPGPGRLVIPDHGYDHDWGFIGKDYKYATAQNTPRFCCPGRVAPHMPAKSLCGDGFFRPYSNHPGYMANTLSSRAKLRSRSAPRQRLVEPGSKKRLSLNEVMASRSSFSGVRMQRLGPRDVHEDFEF